MTEWFSEDDLDRISEFANSPKYMRSPSMLLPEDAEDSDGTATEESDESTAGADDSDGASTGDDDTDGASTEEPDESTTGT